MSAPTLPSRSRDASDSSNNSAPPPPVPAPRTSVSAAISKRRPPLADPQPQQRSSATPSKPKPPPVAGATPPLPKRPAEPLPTPPTQEKGPPLPKRPPEPLPSTPPLQDKGPPLLKRLPEPLPPVLSQAEAPGPALPRRPAEPLPSPLSLKNQSSSPPLRRLSDPPSTTAHSTHPMALASLVKSTTIPVLAVANGESNTSESFGQCLPSATDAIGKRHEDELIALESLRFHIFNRARQDKAYAEELLKTNTRASKKAASVSNPSSPIFQVCVCVNNCECK